MQRKNFKRFTQSLFFIGGLGTLKHPVPIVLIDFKNFVTRLLQCVKLISSKWHCSLTIDAHATKQATAIS
jgi:hypothetical protein